MNMSLFWIMFLGEEGGTGSDTESTSGTEGTQEPVGESSQQETSSGEESEGGESGGHNPNWNGLLEDLPDEYIRGKVIPHLKEFDRNNNKRFETVQQQFAPYKPLVDNNVPFEDVQLAFRLREEVQKNPQRVFEQLAQHLGVDLSRLQQGQGSQNPNPQQQQNKSQGQPQNGLPDGLDLEDLDPRLKAIIEHQAQQQARLEATNNAILQSLMVDKDQEARIQQQRWEEQQYNETVQTLDRLNVPKAQRNFFVQFAVADSQMNGGNVDFDRAWNAYQAQIGNAVQSRANNKAPNVLNGVGNLAAESVDFSKMSDKDVEALAIAKLKQRNGN